MVRPHQPLLSDNGLFKRHIFRQIKGHQINILFCKIQNIIFNLPQVIGLQNILCGAMSTAMVFSFISQSHSKCNVLGMPRGNFFNFGTNIHLKWFIKVTATSRPCSRERDVSGMLHKFGTDFHVD